MTTIEVVWRRDSEKQCEQNGEGEAASGKPSDNDGLNCVFIAFNRIMFIICISVNSNFDQYCLRMLMTKFEDYFWKLIRNMFCWMLGENFKLSVEYSSDLGSFHFETVCLIM